MMGWVIDVKNFRLDKDFMIYSQGLWIGLSFD